MSSQSSAFTHETIVWRNTVYKMMLIKREKNFSLNMRLWVEKFTLSRKGTYAKGYMLANMANDDWEWIPNAQTQNGEYNIYKWL